MEVTMRERSSRSSWERSRERNSTVENMSWEIERG
jgi:hypothetical protein